MQTASCRLVVITHVTDVEKREKFPADWAPLMGTAAHSQSIMKRYGYVWKTERMAPVDFGPNPADIKTAQQVAAAKRTRTTSRGREAEFKGLSLGQALVRVFKPT